MNTNVLKGEIISKFGSIKAFNERLHWKPDKLNRVLNGKQKITLNDMEQLGQALGITNPYELVRVFSLPW